MALSSRARHGLAALLVASVGACLSPATTTCDDGSLCGPGDACASGGGCAPADQVAACDGEGLADGDPCVALGTGDEVCQGGVCVGTGCGNGELGGAEDCDGALLGGAACTDLGFYGGTLACGATCRFDTDGCVGTCGDGTLDAVEACDTSALAACTQYGFDAGRPACSGSCDVDVAPCELLGLQPTLTADAELVDMWMAPTGEVFAVAKDTLFVRQGDVATELDTFDDVGFEVIYDWQRVDGCAADDVWAQRSRGNVGGPAPTFAHWDGAAWTVFDVLPRGDRVSSIACTSAGVAYAAEVGLPFLPAYPTGSVFLSDGATVTELAPVGVEVRALLEHEGELLAATADGLWQHDGDAWSQIALDGVALSSLSAASDGTLWLGTSDGALIRRAGNVTTTRQVADEPLVELAVTAAGVLARTESGALLSEDPLGLARLAGGATIAAVGTDGEAVQLLHDGALHTIERAWTELPYSPGTRPLIAADGALWTAGRFIGAYRDGVLIASGVYDVLWQTGGGAVCGAGAGARFCWDAGALTEAGAPLMPTGYEDFAGSKVLSAAGPGLDDYLVVLQAPVEPFRVTAAFHVTALGTTHEIGGAEVVWGPGDGTYYLARGDAGPLQAFDGVGWNEVDVGAAGAIYDVWGRATDDVHVVGEAGLHRVFDGASWAAMPGAPLTSTLRMIRGSAGGLAALTSSGKVLVHDGIGWLPVRGVELVEGLALDERRLLVGAYAGVQALQHVPQPAP